MIDIGVTCLFIGVDLVELQRIEKLACNPAFLRRAYTDEELRLAENIAAERRIEILAGRFAVKEAVAKALGTGIGSNVSLRDIQTLKGEHGEPVVTLTGKAAELSGKMGIREIKVSLSHAGGIAAAYVLLV